MEKQPPNKKMNGCRDIVHVLCVCGVCGNKRRNDKEPSGHLENVPPPHYHTLLRAGPEYSAGSFLSWEQSSLIFLFFLTWAL